MARLWDVTITYTDGDRNTLVGMELPRALRWVWKLDRLPQVVSTSLRSFPLGGAVTWR